MNTEKQGRGGWRGGGRPKKRPSELQRVRSIRATDKDWAEIRKILPVIKNNKHDAAKKVCVFLLSRDEEASVNSMLIQGLIERRHNALSKSTAERLGQTQKAHDGMQPETADKVYAAEGSDISTFAARRKVMEMPFGEDEKVNIPAEPVAGEDEAIEAFRMFYRLNPVQAAMTAKAGLNKERRIAIARARREEEKNIMDSLEDRIQKALSAADEANRALETAFLSKKL